MLQKIRKSLRQIETPKRFDDLKYKIYMENREYINYFSHIPVYIYLSVMEFIPNNRLTFNLKYFEN